MRRVLDDFDWLWWVDGDTLFHVDAPLHVQSIVHNINPRVNLVVNMYPDLDRFLGRGASEPFMANTFIPRGKSEWSLQYLQSVWQSAAKEEYAFLAQEPPAEQGAMKLYFEDHPQERSRLAMRTLDSNVIDFAWSSWDLHLSIKSKFGCAKAIRRAVKRRAWMAGLVPLEARRCNRTTAFLEGLMMDHRVTGALTSEQKAELIYTMVCISECRHLADNYFKHDL